MYFVYCKLYLYNTFLWTNEAKANKTKYVLDKFKHNCTPKQNVIDERYIFNLSKQAENEDINNTVTKLKIQANNCNFGLIRDSLIRDMTVRRVTDG